MTFDQILAQVPYCRKVGFRVLMGWGYSFEEAEQETLIALWEISLLENTPKNIYGMLKAKLRNKEIDRWRRKKGERGSPHVPADTTGNQSDGVGTIFHQVPAPEALMSADDFLNLLVGLPEDRQELVFLSYYVGYSEQELAEMFSVKGGTIKSRLSRSCKKLGNLAEVTQ